MSNSIKIDIDSMTFRRWLFEFEQAYKLMSTRVRFSPDSRVAQSAGGKGWHVYLTIRSFDSMTEYGYLGVGKEYINLIECLLGSDIKKQRHFFVEGRDILFKVKKYRMEKPRPDCAERLDGIIRKVNRSNQKIKVAEVALQ